MRKGRPAIVTGKLWRKNTNGAQESVMYERRRLEIRVDNFKGTIVILVKHYEFYI